MKLADVLPQLTILPLRRFADAWSVHPMRSEKRDVFEQAILDKIQDIDSDSAVRARLSIFERDIDYIRHQHGELVLRTILAEPGYVIADEVELLRRGVDADAAFFEYAGGSAATRHLDPRTVDIYTSVLEVAWENKVSFDESQLVQRLRRKLSISRRDHRVLELRAIQLTPMSLQEAEGALRLLTNYGFLVQFKHRGQSQVVCPEEVALRLRAIWGMALLPSAYRNLASKLSNATLKEALKQAGQPSVSVWKDFLIDRLIDGDVPPAAVLEKLDDYQLDSLFENFPDERPPTRRAVKIRHLLQHFDKYATAPPVPAADPDQTYFAFLVELASRKYDYLRASNVIQQDQNVDRFFERGVRIAFSKYLGHPPIEFTGSAHADGGISASNQRMVLWDCKSALEPYVFTEGRCAQFNRYIDKEKPNIVSPFMIISGAFTDDGQARSMTLKATCPPGTEIGLMTAADLKWLAERWNAEYPTKRLPLDVLAHTGFLTRDVIEFRLKAFAAQAPDR